MKNFAIAVNTLVAAAFLLALGVMSFAWSGFYPIAAVSGHTAPVAWLLEEPTEQQSRAFTGPSFRRR